MMIQIYNWILFITICIVIIIPTGMFFAVISDVKEDGYGGYFLPLSCLLTGVLPYVGAKVIPLNVLHYICLGCLAIVFLLHLIVTIINFKHSIHYLLSFICTIIVGILTLGSRT